MPNMSGIEVLRNINMPVIMITAYGSKELAMRASEMGPLQISSPSLLI